MEAGAGYHLQHEEADPRCEIVALGPVAVGPDLDKSAVVAGAGSEEGNLPIRAKGHADLMRQARTSGIFTQAIGADPRGGAAHGMARKDIAVALEAAGAHARKTGRSEGAGIRVRDLRKPLDRVGAPSIRSERSIPIRTAKLSRLAPFRMARRDRYEAGASPGAGSNLSVRRGSAEGMIRLAILASLLCPETAGSSIPED